MDTEKRDFSIDHHYHDSLELKKMRNSSGLFI